MKSNGKEPFPVSDKVIQGVPVRNEDDKLGLFAVTIFCFQSFLSVV